MDITDILSLIEGERFGDDNRYNMASTTQNDCHNYSLAGESDCLGAISPITLYIEVPSFDPIEYQKIERVIETGNNEELPVWTLIKPRIKFTIYGNQSLVNQLNQLALHETITFTNIPDALSVDITSMDIAATPVDDHLRIEVTMSIADSSIISKICCGSYYDGAPFNECDGEGETGDPSNDPECNDYVVAITYSAGPPVELSASTTGGGAGVETFTWYLDDEFFGTGSTIQPVLPGVYRVDAEKGNCQAQDEYTFSGDCGDFAVTIEEIALEDGSTLLLAVANMTATIQWEEEIAAVWTEIVGETGLTFIPETDGTYRAVATTSGGCEATSNEVIIELPVDCAGLFTITIANNDGDLEVTINDYAGVDTPTYAWYKDTGSGLTLLPSETGATIAGASPGYYVVGVTLDGCTQSEGLLIQCDYDTITDDCGCESPSNYHEFVGTGSEDSFAITNFFLADPDHVNATEIGATYLVQREGVTINYDAAPSGQTEFAIDYANQEITIDAAFPLGVGETLTVRKLRCIKL